MLVINIKLGICLHQGSYVVTFRLGSFWYIKCHKKFVQGSPNMQFYFPSRLFHLTPTIHSQMCAVDKRGPSK